MRQLFRAGDTFPRTARGPADGLPPGQRELSTFPRYGTHFSRRDPAVPDEPLIEVTGPSIDPVELDADALASLPRVDLVADFHCVAGWTARDLHWQGVRLRDVYETHVAGRADPAVTHVRAEGRDGFRSVLLLEDALADDVLLADRLDGAPLPVEHGAPCRLLSASQYGFKSVKSLRRIEFHAEQPSDNPDRSLDKFLLKPVAPHLRARVWHEERHRLLPNGPLRVPYFRVVHPVAYVLGYLGARRNGNR